MKKLIFISLLILPFLSNAQISSAWIRNNGTITYSAFFNNAAATTFRTATTLYNLADAYTGESAIFKKVSDTTGIVIDSVLYCKKTGTGEVFKRVLQDGKLNPEWYGLIGDGITENGSNVNRVMLKIKQYGAGYNLQIPANKTFLCSTPFSLPGNHFTLSGANKWTSIIKSNAPTPSGVYSVLFGLDYGVSIGCTIENIRFETYDAGRIVMAGGQVKDFVINNCTSNTNLVDFQSGSYAKNLQINQYGNLDPYDSTTTTNLNYNVRVTNNILESYRNISLGKSAIGIGYTDGAVISGNIISGYGQGISYWGGDAAGYQGLYPSPKWLRHITITNNKVSTIWGGGIWGSNGENITIGNNSVNDCGDVGIDVEGSSRVAIDGNVVENCTNGGITTFFDCSAINVSGNTVSSSANNSYLFQIYQAFQTTDNEDISVSNNTFRHIGNTGISIVGGDNARDFTLSGNILINTKINANANNYKTLEISNNKLRFYNAIADSSAVINAGGYHTNARAYILNNTVTSLVSQPLGIMAIYVADGDFNTNNKAFIEGNITEGFNRDIVVNAITNNTDIVPAFYINNNVLGNAHFERYEKLGRSSVILSGNRDGLNRPFPLAIPTSGKWDAGQRIEFAVPDALGNTTAICITQGTPGTWKAQGGFPPTLPEYSDNAAAISAGLTNGAFYKTGDAVKQVHP